MQEKNQSTHDTYTSFGLDDVVVAETAIGAVHGDLGLYQYRGYDAVELARRLPYEAVWHLVTLGTVPDRRSLRDWRELTAASRELPPALEPVLRVLARESHDPMHSLRSALSCLFSLQDLRPWIDTTPSALQDQAVRIASVTPTIVAALHRLEAGREPLPPRRDLSHAECFLWMLHGEVPDRRVSKALETYWSATVDHGLNASTFTGRVIASTGADLGSVVTGALAALSGPLHGGAPSRVLDMLDAIAHPSNARVWLTAALDRGDRLMGFGHRIYRGGDPRAALLHEVAVELGSSRVPLAEAVEEEALSLLARRHPGRDLCTNVEFWAAPVLEAVGLDRLLQPVAFASSRVVAWLAHAIEQTAGNRIMRPRSRYVGPVPDPAKVKVPESL